MSKYTRSKSILVSRTRRPRRCVSPLSCGGSYISPGLTKVYYQSSLWASSLSYDRLGFCALNSKTVPTISLSTSSKFSLRGFKISSFPSSRFPNMPI